MTSMFPKSTPCLSLISLYQQHLIQLIALFSFLSFCNTILLFFFLPQESFPLVSPTGFPSSPQFVHIAQPQKLFQGFLSSLFKSIPGVSSRIPTVLNTHTACNSQRYVSLSPVPAYMSHNNSPLRPHLTIRNWPKPI